MKRLLLILIFTLSFHTLSKADDISDFELEGITIGDSLLDYYSKEEINSFLIVKYPSDEKFIGWESTENIIYKKYKAMTFHVKKMDPKYKIYSMKAMLDFDDKLDECLKKKDIITNQIKNFSGIQKIDNYENNFGNKIGTSKAYIVDFFFKKKDKIRVWCSKWDKENTRSKDWIDTLNVGVSTTEFNNWLNKKAYK